MKIDDNYSLFTSDNLINKHQPTAYKQKLIEMKWSNHMPNFLMWFGMLYILSIGINKLVEGYSVQCMIENINNFF